MFVDGRALMIGRTLVAVGLRSTSWAKPSRCVSVKCVFIARNICDIFNCIVTLTCENTAMNVHKWDVVSNMFGYILRMRTHCL